MATALPPVFPAVRGLQSDHDLRYGMWVAGQAQRNHHDSSLLAAFFSAWGVDPRGLLFAHPVCDRPRPQVCHGSRHALPPHPRHSHQLASRTAPGTRSSRVTALCMAATDVMASAAEANTAITAAPNPSSESTATSRRPWSSTALASCQRSRHPTQRLRCRRTRPTRGGLAVPAQDLTGE